MKKTILICLPVILLLAGLARADAPPAYRERVTTPHWNWVDRHAGGTVRALCITSFLGTREPEELAQRFDIEVEVVPVKANPSGLPRSYDEEYLKEALERDPDVILVPYRGAWGKLSDDAKTALETAISGGTPLIALSPGGVPKSWRTQPSEELVRDGQREAERDLPAGRLTFPWGRDDGGLRLQVHEVGKGRFVSVPMGHGRGRGFNSLIPTDEDPPVLPARYETSYAVFARLVRWAAGRQSDQRCSLHLASEPRPGDALEVRAVFDPPARAALTVEWELRSASGERLKTGEQAVGKGEEALEFAVPLRRVGELTLLYRARRDGDVVDYCAVPVPVASPATITEVRVPAFNEPGAKVPVEWSVEGDEGEVTGFLLQVYDPENRLVSWKRCDAQDRECRLDGWPAREVSHRLRLLVLGKGGTILHERRVPLQVQVDRSADPSRYHVIVWGTENGATQEQWRYRRLRQLGITAFSGVGKRRVVSEMASAAGLRPAPVNVCVPPNRYKKEFNPAEEREELEAYTRDMAPLSPLGYSLADEPANAEPWRFRDWAARIIHRHDPGARVGYCGTRMHVGKDVPQIMRSSDFHLVYTPNDNLYDTNVWRGMEREFHRSFAPADFVVGGYTHYAPWADHEPYSRTVPWLLLFTGHNAISYFASAGGNFSILPADLRTTHETRWWSQEVRELQRGVARQLISMRRDTGGIAVLFPTEIPKQLAGTTKRAVRTWARALHDLNLPYEFIARNDLGDLAPAVTRLLICPVAVVLTQQELNAIDRYVRDGGTLVAQAPFALYEPERGKREAPDFWEKQPPKEKPPAPTGLEKEEAITDESVEELIAEDEPEEPVAPPPGPAPLNLRKLCGVRRLLLEEMEREPLLEAVAFRSGIPAMVSWSMQPEAEPVELEVRTGGMYGLERAGAEVCGGFRNPAEDAPKFARQALGAPAALRFQRDQGTVYYLNFAPTVESAQTLAGQFRTATGASGPPANVSVNGEPAKATYLYPLGGGGVRTLGIIQDYARVHPAVENKDERTAIYYHHGPQRWEERDAVLELDQPAHIYDMRQKRYLGRGRTAEFGLRPGEPELFALLPYRVSGLEVDVPDAIQAGGALPVRARLLTDEGEPGDHVVHARLRREDGTVIADNFMLEEGKGTFRVPTAFNDPPGEWTLRVTDVLSGVQAERKIRLSAAGDTGSVLARRPVEVERVPREWPQGQWQPYVEPEGENLISVAVHAGGIGRKRIHHGPFSGTVCLRSKTLIGLRGRQANYQLTYFACNDWKKYGWEDKRRIKAHSLSGLGIKRPASHLWYYNGYIDILYDDERVTGYRISDVRTVDAGRNGRVDVTWESPAGEAVLSFGLTLEGEALLQQLQVRPGVPVEVVKVRFKSYPGGFARPSASYVRTPAGRKKKSAGYEFDPQEAPWAFYADEINDRAYGKGKGAGGILVLPEDWDRVRYGHRGELKKKVDLQPGQSAAFHWALWIYPDRTNEEAYRAFTAGRQEARKQLRSFFDAQ